jgi:hypothetical protein
MCLPEDVMMMMRTTRRRTIPRFDAISPERYRNIFDVRDVEISQTF